MASIDRAAATQAHHLSDQLRDTVLQDVLALAMLTAALRCRLDAAVDGLAVIELLGVLERTLDRDVELLREAITELRAA